MDQLLLFLRKLLPEEKIEILRIIKLTITISTLTGSIKLLNSLLSFFTCRDGQSRAGVYCAANACIEQVIQHGEVDVFQAVKTVRRHRPQLVENIVST